MFPGRSLTGNVNLPFDIVGNPPSSAGASRTANYVSVSPDYFRVMGIPLLAGRVFNQHDISSAPRVSIISEAMARLYFPNQNPLGKQITFGFPRGSGGAMREIVGIVGDVRDVALGQNPGAMMYVPYAQAPFWGANLVVKSTLSTSSVAAAIRQEVQKIDKDLPVTDVAKMPDAYRRFGRAAQISHVLARPLRSYGAGARGYRNFWCDFLFGVAPDERDRHPRRARRFAQHNSAHDLARNSDSDVRRPCRRDSRAHSRLLTLLGHMLFNVSANDPATLAAVAFALAAVAALAGYIPARRAMRVDPMVALRYE